MTKTIKTILLVIIIIFSFQIFSPNALALESLEFTPQVPIPGENSEFKEGQENIPVGEYREGKFIKIGPEGNQSKVEVTTLYSTLLPKYIRAIYNYGIGIAAFLALAMIVAGGLIWLTSGGSTEKIGTARSMIVSAIIGLVLLLGTYTLLQIVSPALLNLKPIKTEYIGPIEMACCWFEDERKALTMTERECTEEGGQFKLDFVASADKSSCVDINAEKGCCLFDKDDEDNYQGGERNVKKMCDLKDDGDFRERLWVVEDEDGNKKCSTNRMYAAETSDNGCTKYNPHYCANMEYYECLDSACDGDLNDNDRVICCCATNIDEYNCEKAIFVP
jgi:hypothetical protein